MMNRQFLRLKDVRTGQSICLQTLFTTCHQNDCFTTRHEQQTNKNSRPLRSCRLLKDALANPESLSQPPSFKEHAPTSRMQSLIAQIISKPITMQLLSSALLSMLALTIKMVVTPPHPLRRKPSIWFLNLPGQLLLMQPTLLMRSKMQSSYGMKSTRCYSSMKQPSMIIFNEHTPSSLVNVLTSCKQN